MTEPLLQNFDIPANSDQDVTLTINSSIPGDTLAGARVFFRAYEQQFGAPVPGVDPVLEYSSDSGGAINILPSPPMTVVISFSRGDTVELLRNYYYEITVLAVDNSEYPPTCGIMTVTPTENRVT